MTEELERIVEAPPSGRVKWKVALALAATAAVLYVMGPRSTESTKNIPPPEPGIYQSVDPVSTGTIPPSPTYQLMITVPRSSSTNAVVERLFQPGRTSSAEDLILASEFSENAAARNRDYETAGAYSLRVQAARPGERIPAPPEAPRIHYDHVQPGYVPFTVDQRLMGRLGNDILVSPNGTRFKLDTGLQRYVQQ